MSARSRSGHFAVKNPAATIASEFDGTASTEAVFLMKTASASSKSASETDFAHHSAALSRRFSSACSNARSRADITQIWDRGLPKSGDVTERTVPGVTLRAFSMTLGRGEI
jgi:hypothetical protein